MNKLYEMSDKSLTAYLEKWRKKRAGFKDGSKNHRKASRRIKRASSILAKRG